MTATAIREEDLVSVERLDAEFESDETSTKVLDDITFTVGRGERLGIVGESGSGKTTLSLLLGGLQAENCVVTHGSVTTSGMVTAAEGSPTLPRSLLRRLRREEIAFVVQDPMGALDPTMRIGFQFATAMRAAGRPMTSKEVVTALSEVNISEAEDVVRLFPHEVSGGMAQRIVIALALARRPQLIIADEPTAALDAETRREVLDLLVERCEQHNNSLIWVSHDLPAVERWCTRAIVVRHGRIVEQGSTEEMFNNPQQPYTRELVTASRPPLQRRTEADPDSTVIVGTAEAILETADLPPALEMDSVSVSLGRGRRRTPILEDISLCIPAGSTAGLIGTSGSGKTTTAKLALGLISPNRGTIRIAGRDHRSSRRERAGRMQAVFQNPTAAFNPRRTIGRSVAEPLRSTRVRLTAADEEREVARMLGHVDLDSALTRRYPHELSGGQLQRAAIARALITQPAFVVFDEAVSALDVAVRRKILHLIRSLQNELGFGALFITHELSAAAEISDTITVLSRGRVVESGPTNDIFTTPQHPYTINLLETA